jgi:hypothetical protein
VWQPEFLDIYLRLGADYRLPICLSRDVGRMAPPEADFAPAFAALQARGNPDFLTYLTTPFGNLKPTEADYRKILDRAVPGLNWGAFHFTPPGDFEMFSDDAPLRIAEYDLFRSGRGKALFEELGLQLVGLRQMRDAMRAGDTKSA